MSSILASTSQYEITLGYNLLVIGAHDAYGMRESISRFMREPMSDSESPLFLRENQKPIALGDNRVLALDIIARPGAEFHECTGDIVRTHGVLLVYSPTSRASFEHVLRFHAHLRRSKWAAVPAVLFASIPKRRGTLQVDAQDGRAFAERHGVQFVECSLVHPFPVPFIELLNLVRMQHERRTPVQTSLGAELVGRVAGVLRRRARSASSSTTGSSEASDVLTQAEEAEAWGRRSRRRVIVSYVRRGLPHAFRREGSGLRSGAAGQSSPSETSLSSA